ncbi:MAG: hypothetical protein L7S55_01465 [Luminiphilus sp.]|nr:hypothetical protein [Luminiphilus sp.]
MIRLLMVIGFALVTTQASAQVQVPKSYSDGEVIDADELNTNLEAIAGAVPPRTCTTDQIIKWDGSAWVCASLSGPLLETVYVDCTEGFATPETCSASCAAGKQLVSGGCQFTYLKDAIYLQSTPNGNSWSCGIGDGGVGSHVDSAYAICQ